jgi:hypothetical protein
MVVCAISNDGSKGLQCHVFGMHDSVPCINSSPCSSIRTDEEQFVCDVEFSQDDFAGYALSLLKVYGMHSSRAICKDAILMPRARR